MKESVDPQSLFLSEESIARHKEYVRNLRLKYSILQKSETLLKSTNIRDIKWQKMSSDLASEAFFLLSEITLHGLFFDSFSPITYQPLPSCVRSVYTTSAELLNSIFRLASEGVGGFIILYRDADKLMIARVLPPYRELLYVRPLLAIDLFEHTYFSDYGFAVSDYLIAALPHLDLSRLG